MGTEGLGYFLRQMGLAFRAKVSGAKSRYRDQWEPAGFRA